MAKRALTGKDRAAAEAAIARHALRKKGALRLAMVPSTSRNEVVHSIMLGSDGLVYCTCEKWTYADEDKKGCGHMDAFRAMLRVKQ